VALVHLVARLRRGGYRLLDTQFITPHLASLGAVELPRARYKRLLQEVVGVPANAARAFDPALMRGAGALAALRS
jgi:leucyl/phenylalanyl-tRNA--protein transferase